MLISTKFPHNSRLLQAGPFINLAPTKNINEVGASHSRSHARRLSAHQQTRRGAASYIAPRKRTRLQKHKDFFLPNL